MCQKRHLVNIFSSNWFCHEDDFGASVPARCKYQICTRCTYQICTRCTRYVPDVPDLILSTLTCLPSLCLTIKGPPLSPLQESWKSRAYIRFRFFLTNLSPCLVTSTKHFWVKSNLNIWNSFFKQVSSSPTSQVFQFTCSWKSKWVGEPDYAGDAFHGS